MDNITNLFNKKEGFEVEYIYSGDVITGITHPDWPYCIVRNGAQRALVCKETNEVFGKLMKDDFNTILMCWLLIDDPDLIDAAAKDDK